MKYNNPKHGSQNQHDFARIPSVTMPRSTFNRTRTTKTTFDGGFLYPILCDELLPGDTVHLNMSNFVRLSTPLNPILDNMYLETQFYAVPLRLLWTNFKRMMGEQDDPADTIEYFVPQMTSASGTTRFNVLSAYMGIPLRNINVLHSSLWHRAYARVWNEWYRDENLQDSIIQDMDDGPDTEGDYVLMRRGKRKDYYTSALPFAQKGPTVDLPLGLTAPVAITTTGTGKPTWNIDGDEFGLISNATTGAIFHDLTDPAGTDVTHAQWNQHMLEGTADLSMATGSTINALRENFAIQALLERDARGGTRYVESLRSHWGVTSPDFRLQRSEYLGGGSQRINVTPVAGTNQGPVPSTVGALGAYGTSSGSGHGFVYSSTEHQVLIGLVSVRADLTYQTGLPRMFSRRDRYDFYVPDLAHLGEQEILVKEVFSNPGGGNDDDVWGYAERWSEYRYGESLCTGLFSSYALGSLDVWHLAQEFTTAPVLGDTFIQDTPPIDRIVQTPADPHFIGDFYFKMKHSRVMPTFSVPGLNNRF